MAFSQLWCQNVGSEVISGRPPDPPPGNGNGRGRGRGRGWGRGGRTGAAPLLSFTADEWIVEKLQAGTSIIAEGTGGDGDTSIREIGNIIGDTGGLYRLVYTGHTGAYTGTNPNIFFATSTDGLTWTKGGQLTLGRASEDPYLVKQNGTYYLYVEDKDDVPFRNIRLFTSTNFTDWTDQGDVLDIGIGWEDQDVSSPIVWVDGSTWNMLYEGRATANQEGAIGHATSTDGITWSKNGSNPIVTGVNSTFGYTGPVKWAQAIVPDGLRISSDGEYVMLIHGQDINANVWAPGVLRSSDFTTWTDAIGGNQTSLSDGVVKFNNIAGNNFHFYYPGEGIRLAAERTEADMAWTLIDSWDQSIDGNVSAVTVNNINYDEVLVELDGVGIASAGTVRMRLGSDNSTVDSGASDYVQAFHGSTGATAYTSGGGANGAEISLSVASATTGHNASCEMNLFSTTAKTRFKTYAYNASLVRDRAGVKAASEANNILQIASAAGDLNAGVIRVYGR